jgi:hypothetical protein
MRGPAWQVTLELRKYRRRAVYTCDVEAPPDKLARNWQAGATPYIDYGRHGRLVLLKPPSPVNGLGLTLKTHANPPGITPVAQDTATGCSVDPRTIAGAPGTVTNSWKGLQTPAILNTPT